MIGQFADSNLYIPGLDGLRALSIGLVLAAHFGFERYVPGGLGVTIFFFISGFLITTRLLRQARSRGHISVGGFYTTRLLRLYPELLLLVVVSSAVASPFVPVRGADVAAALAYGTNYLVMIDEARHAPHTAWPHLWSLAVEEHFYLTFPWLFAALWRRPRLFSAALVGTCAAALGWRLWIVAQGPPFGFLETGAEQPYTAVASECRLDSIAFGCLTALRFAHRPESILRRPRLASVLGLAGVGLLLLSLSVRQEAFRDSLRYTVQGLGLCGAFVGLYSVGGRGVLRILEHPWLRRAGVLSYGAYLWHMELRLGFMGLTDRALDTLPWVERVGVLVGASACSFWLADLSWRLARPARRLRQKLGFAATPRAAAQGLPA